MGASSQIRDIPSATRRRRHVGGGGDTKDWLRRDRGRTALSAEKERTAVYLFLTDILCVFVQCRAHFHSRGVRQSIYVEEEEKEKEEEDFAIFFVELSRLASKAASCGVPPPPARHS